MIVAESSGRIRLNRPDDSATQPPQKPTATVPHVAVVARRRFLSEGRSSVPGMLIDCDSCEMRDIACDDCVINVLLGAPPEVELADDTAAALRHLADGGLVPPLRHRPHRRAAG